MERLSFDAGLVNITSFTLVHPEGTIDLLNTRLAVSIDIYENILFPVMTASVLINDALGFIEKVTMDNAYIEIEFVSYDPAQNSSKYKFNISSIKDSSISLNDKIKGYKLHCISEEGLKGISKIMSKRLNGNASDIVSSLFNDEINSEKELTIEQTQGILDSTITKLNVFQAIDFVKRRSVSRSSKSSTYCFFENKNGFNFITIEEMIARGSEKVGDKVFFYYSNVSENSNSSHWRNIITYEQNVQYDTIKQISTGALNNVTYAFDIFTGQYTEVKYEDIKQSDEFKIGNSNFTGVSKENQQKYGSTPGKLMVIPTDSYLESSKLEDKMGYIQSYVAKLLSNIIRIKIYGDSALVAGDVIRCEFPVIDGMTGNKEENKILTGEYLICKIRHHILLDNRVQYYQTCEILKSGFGG
jgi:hypothetical protein